MWSSGGPGKRKGEAGGEGRGMDRTNGTNLTLSLELVKLVTSLAVTAEVDIQLLAVRTVLLLVEAPRALERGPMTSRLGDTQDTITAIFLAS